MGNEQSSGSTPSSSTSTFSFLSNRGASLRKSKGIVTVSDGSVKQATLEEDEVYKRFKEIPRFVPILPNTVGKKDVDSHSRMSSRPIHRFSLRLHEHMSICNRTVGTDQAALSTTMKKAIILNLVFWCRLQIDRNSQLLFTTLSVKKSSLEKLQTSLSHLPKLADEVMKIQLLLEELVPVAETLNELLTPADRLPQLNLRKVLVRTPASSSGSSLQSTPRRLPYSDDAPIEEIQVVDTQVDQR